MKKLTFITILFALFGLESFAQDGHIRYKEYGNSHFFGRTVVQRSDATNLDTLTSVYSGTIAFDTVQNVAKVYNGSEWSSLSVGNIRDTTITIGTAAVLTLNTTPVTIVPAPGAGYAIQVVAACFNIDFNSVPYATNTGIVLVTSTGTVQQANADISSSVDQISNFRITEAGSPTAVQIVENQALQVTVSGGDPTAGDSDVKVYLSYKVIEL